MVTWLPRERIASRRAAARSARGSGRTRRTARSRQPVVVEGETIWAMSPRLARLLGSASGARRSTGSSTPAVPPRGRRVAEQAVGPPRRFAPATIVADQRRRRHRHAPAAARASGRRSGPDGGRASRSARRSPRRPWRVERACCARSAPAGAAGARPSPPRAPGPASRRRACRAAGEYLNEKAEA
jgi:hypothetical protein